MKEPIKVTVPINDLTAIHNELCSTFQTGDNMIKVSNCIMTLRRLIETSPKADAAEASNDDAEEVNDDAEEVNDDAEKVNDDAEEVNDAADEEH